jgi:catechol 2,3-dioxygenase-like lactoylglutathione lyase family enzyme
MVHVLGSRILLSPTDPQRSRDFYGRALGLAVYREFGTGPERGTVYFLGGGFLELSGRSDAPPSLRAPQKEPWGLVEMWIADPDGVRIAVVEVPEDHPLRYRP